MYLAILGKDRAFMEFCSGWPISEMDLYSPEEWDPVLVCGNFVAISGIPRQKGFKVVLLTSGGSATS